MAEGHGLTNEQVRAVMAEFLDRYSNNIVLMVQEVWGVDPDDWQREVLEAAVDPKIRNISIRSGHGVGKTAVLAWIVIHHILTRWPQKTVCTAPTSAQLFDALASEVKSWINRLPPLLAECLVVKSDRIEFHADPDGSFISFRTSRPETPEALAGIHSEHVLIIGDEASGIPEVVFTAGQGSMSGENALTILAGNPVRTSGTFFDTHHKLKSRWKTFHVNCVNSPRVARKFIEEIREKYGERSNEYRVRVLGEFPLADEDTVIPFELAESAKHRDVKPMQVKTVWGVDVARFGSDRTVLAKRRGNDASEPPKAWYGLDTMQAAGRIKLEWDETPVSERPDEILVDVIGLGAGVCDRLREMGLPARGINVSESPAFKEKFMNLRAELWWAAREWFESRAVYLGEHNDDLAGELVAVKYDVTSSGKIQVESKKEMKKRGLVSPDLADAFILTFAGTAATALHGAGGKPKSKLKRLIKGLV